MAHVEIYFLRNSLSQRKILSVREELETNIRRASKWSTRPTRFLQRRAKAMSESQSIAVKVYRLPEKSWQGLPSGAVHFPFKSISHSWPIVPVAGLYSEGLCCRLPAGQLAQSYGKCCVSSAELKFGKFLTLERARDRASRVAKSQCPKRRCQSAVSSAGVRVLIVWYRWMELT